MADGGEGERRNRKRWKVGKSGESGKSGERRRSMRGHKRRTARRQEGEYNLDLWQFIRNHTRATPLVLITNIARSLMRQPSRP
jgi:hypothetical protein